MSNSKQIAKDIAFSSGVVRCPCCDVQLVWKPYGKSQKNMATVDHILPRSSGGADSAGNLFIMCYSCNKKRGTKCFINFMTDHGMDEDDAKRIFITGVNASVSSMVYAVVQGNNSKKFKENKNNFLALARYVYSKLGNIDCLPDLPIVMVNGKVRWENDKTDEIRSFYSRKG